MSHKFQLYLNPSPEIQHDCIQVLNAKFDTDVEQWYKDPVGNFKNFFRLKTSKNGNKWKIAKEIRDAHNGVIEVDPVGFLKGQTGAYDSDEDYPDPGSVKWNHDLTKFPDAIAKSIADGKLIEGKPSSIRVAHLDTGVTKHPELPVFLETGYNFVEENNDVTDLMKDGLLRQPGHGTGTASVIVGQKQNVSNDFNDGVFPYANLVPYRIANSVVHFMNSNIDEAVIHAVKNKVDVITMSMGGAPARRSWREAAQFAYDNGVIFCSAAGNNVKFVIWPAAYDEVIAVAGINYKKEPWEGSCRGKAVDISAPGENVYVARSSEGDNNEMVYDQGFGCGTSHATPHVAAAAALWLNYYKKEIDESIAKPSDKVDMFKIALKYSVQPHVNGAYKSDYGPGILDAMTLLKFSPQYIKDTYGQELKNIGTSLNSGRGVRSLDAEQDLLKKEMLDLMLNHDHEDYAGMLEYIDKEGTEEAKLAFDTLKANAPAPRGERGNRAISATELKEVKQIFATDIIEGNF